MVCAPATPERRVMCLRHGSFSVCARRVEARVEARETCAPESIRARVFTIP